MESGFLRPMTPLTAVMMQLAGSIIVITLVFALAPPIFAGDIETARNYLNTIAQTLATIFALCITIVMVVIQLSASRYSHRALDFFIRFPYNSSLFMLYLFTIVHAIYMLSILQELPGGWLPDWQDRAVSVDLFLLLICILSLLAYMYAVMQLLKPQTIVSTIEREYIIAYRKGRYEEALDRIEQIADVGKRSIADMDAITGIRAVEKITDLLHATRLPSAIEDTVLWYHRRILDQLLGIASISFKVRETVVSTTILDELYEMGIRYVKSGSLQAAGLIIEGFTLIVMNNLVGQQQTNMIERAVVYVYQITCTVVESEHDPKETFQFCMHSFEQLHEIARQVLITEPYGPTFVAKHIASRTFGELVSTIICKDGPTFPVAVVYELIHEYIKMVKLLMQHASIHDIVTITTWLREEMLPHQGKGKHILPYLYLYLLINAIALYLQRNDIVTTVVRAIGKYFYPFHPVQELLLSRRLDIRPFFDYHEPERYIREVYTLWEAYHGFTVQQENASVPNPIGMIRNEPDWELWRDLFEGSDGRGFLPPTSH